MRILMIEDDTELCEAVSAGLCAAGFAVDTCADGEDGFYYLKQNIYDACLLDRMLPNMDGLTLLRKARANGIATPVMMLTALGRVGDRVDGLESGADDYLVKPFDMRELIARLHALVRRPAGAEPNKILKCGDTSLDLSELVLKGKAGEAALSKKECELLEAFFKNSGRLLSRQTLLGRVWGADAQVEESSLDSYIHFVRRRLAAVGSDLKLTTVRGAGYRLEGGV